jgi:hypothetical protein
VTKNIKSLFITLPQRGLPTFVPPFYLRLGIRNRLGYILGAKFIAELMTRTFFYRKAKLDKKSRSNFLAILKEHNHRLADEFNLDSGKYGYF